MTKTIFQYAALLFLLAFLATGCGGNSKSENGQAESPKKQETDSKDLPAFASGIWVNRDQIEKLKQGEFVTMFESPHVVTFYAAHESGGKSVPTLESMMPDVHMPLKAGDGKWGDNEQSFRFFAEGGDTLLDLRGYHDQDDIMVRVPSAFPEEPDRRYFLPDDHIFTLYYFPGTYKVTTDKGEKLDVTINDKGEIRGLAPWTHATIRLFADTPILALEEKASSEADYTKRAVFAFEDTKDGFVLKEALNGEELELDTEVEIGGEVYGFVVVD